MHVISNISLIKFVSKKIGFNLNQTPTLYFNLLFSANHTAAKPRSNICQRLKSIIL